MSVSQAKAFIDQYNNDKEFRDKIVAAPTKEEKIAIRKAAGYEFTPEEFVQMARENAPSEEDAPPLSDEMLEMIAGGSWWKKAENTASSVVSDVSSVTSTLGAGFAVGGIAGAADQATENFIVDSVIKAAGI